MTNFHLQNSGIRQPITLEQNDFFDTVCQPASARFMAYTLPCFQVLQLGVGPITTTTTATGDCSENPK